jgi:integrase
MRRTGQRRDGTAKVPGMKPRSHTYGMGRIFRKVRTGVPYGNWIVEYFVRGGQRRENSSSRDEQAALRLLKQRLAEVQSGRSPAAGAGTVTLGDLIDDLRDRYALEGRPNLKNVRSYRAAWAAVLDLDMRAADLRTTALTGAALRWQAAQIAPASINKRMQFLRRALSLGASVTPARVTMIPTFPPKLAEDNVREGWFADGTVAQLLAHIGARDPVVRDVLEWFFWTGMRPGAIRDLAWPSIDRQTWALRLVKKPRANKGKPKLLPLRGPLRAIIQRAWERRLAHAKATGVVVEWVFWRVHDGPALAGLAPGDPVRVVDYRKLWTSACAAVGCVGMVPYDLRRTAVRNMLRATGNDEATCMAITGHKTRAMIQRYNIGEAAELEMALARTFQAHQDVLGRAPEEGVRADVGRIFSDGDPQPSVRSLRKARK